MRRVLILLACLPVSTAVAACAGTPDPLPPEEAMMQAKATLDDTSGVRFSISTDDLPEGALGLTEARGTLTRAPAFDGTLRVPVKGLEVKIEVVAVDGEVHALLPFTTDYQTIDPADYGMPDPAGLLDPDTGISQLLAATTDLEQGESIRGGHENREIFTEYTGTVPGEAVAEVIPGSEGEVEATYTITDAGVLSEAVLHGHFTGEDHPANTYTLQVDEYDVDDEITAP